jgi:tetratricopeptide (TPR) repeat protein
MSDIHEYFSGFGNRIKYIQFMPWDNEQLIDYMNEYFDHHITFANDNLVCAIVQSAFGNPTRLSAVLEYLKSECIISENNSEYYCNPFDEKFLLIRTEEYILKQYNNLDPHLQLLLRGSSVIGYEFDKQLLTEPLHLLLSDYQLKKIEYLTQMIHLKVDNIYEFNTNAIYLSIKNIVTPAEHLEWNITLGKFFFQEGIDKQNRNILVEAVNDFIKSAFFYQAVEMHKEAVHIYLRLIPMLISLMNYCLAIGVIDNIRRIYSQKPGALTLEQYNRLYLFEAQCRYSLFQYPDSVAAYQMFLNFSTIPTLQRLSVSCQYAMALYCSNEVMRPYQILLEGLETDKKIKTLEARSVEAKVLSFISSIEETLGKQSHIECFLKAIEISKKYHIDNEYYQLLRKALIVYKGEIGIRLMSEAMNYYKNSGNRKEYAMCLHNIAIEMLYHDDLEMAKSYLDESAEIFESFGSAGIHYILAAIGGYWCLKGRFRKALTYFEKAYKDEYGDFSKIGVLINMATALRNMGYCSRSRKLLIKAETLFSQNDNIECAIIRQHCALNIALTEQAAKNYEYAYKSYLDYFSQEINPDSHRCVIAARKFQELCILSDKPFPIEYSGYLKRTSQAIERLAAFSLVLVRFSFSE